MVRVGFLSPPWEVHIPPGVPRENCFPFGGWKSGRWGPPHLKLNQKTPRATMRIVPRGSAGTLVRTRENPGPQGVGSRRELASFLQ